VITIVKQTLLTYSPRAIPLMQSIPLLTLNTMVLMLVFLPVSIKPHNQFLDDAVVAYLPTPY
jgi:hypothetical protein